tara:strand:+ start:2570 stop:2968 length:399 start_codon:yes stop_codon:yes gene_type:complete
MDGLNAHQEETALLDLLRKYVEVEGGMGGSYKDNKGVASAGMGGGGRAGIDNIPIGELLLRGGVSGNFNKYRAEFDTDMQNQGAPDQVSGSGARLTGADIGARFPNGLDVGLDYSTPTPKERQFMLRFKKDF